MPGIAVNHSPLVSGSRKVPAVGNLPGNTGWKRFVTVMGPNNYSTLPGKVRRQFQSRKSRGSTMHGATSGYPDQAKKVKSKAIRRLAIEAYTEYVD
jgi:hypothetical protein